MLGEKEALRAARELFDAFLQIAVGNCRLITASPAMWAYGQTEAVLSHKFGHNNRVQKFVRIKCWIKEYCDGKDRTDVLAFKSNEEWKQYFFRENWHAPAWLKAWGSRFLASNTLLWDRLDEQNALQRLDKEETEQLLDHIAERFWLAVEVELEGMARLASINLASYGTIGEATKQSSQDDAGQSCPPEPRSNSRGADSQGGIERNRGTRSGALMSKYRSELKRGILMQLITKPNATDLEICRGLDADGAVELPSSWKVRPGDRLFAGAYSSPRSKRRVEIAISKIRVDLRRLGLLD